MEEKRKQLRILLDDGGQIARGTGIGKYSLYLGRALRHIGCEVTFAKDRFSGTNRRAARLSYLRYLNSRAFRRAAGQYDVVLFTNYAVPFHRHKHTKYAVTVHDLASFLHPETLPRAYAVYNRAMVRNAAKRAGLILTVSQSAASEIAAAFPKARERVRVTPIGVYDGIRQLETYPPYEAPCLRERRNAPFFLFVSTVEKRKNVGFVIDAFLRLKETVPSAAPYQLVIAGRPGYGYEEFVHMANASPHAPDILFTGFLSDDDCNRLYHEASAFVFPTIYEGFGLSQIECMQCRLPILLSDIPTNLEISRDYGEFFSLSDPATLMEKMQLITDGKYPREERNAVAERILSAYTWENAAIACAQYLRELCEEEPT